MRRRLVVALALVATDAAAALCVVEGAHVLNGRLAFEAVAGDLNLFIVPTIACLIYGVVGLYVGYGPSPAERLRLRSLGTCALAIVWAFASGPGTSLSQMAGIGVTALTLIVVGFYAEAAARGVLIRCGLWVRQRRSSGRAAAPSPSPMRCGRSPSSGSARWASSRCHRMRPPV